MPKPVFKVLFVCMGNICRSPAAEGVMNHTLEKEGWTDRVQCDSAGTIGYHTGNQPDPRMRRAALDRGITLSSRARQIQPEDLHRFDLILTMDEDNHAYVRNLTSSQDLLGKIRPFCEFVTRFPDREVPDPYYGGEQGFAHVMDLLEDGCQGVLNHLKLRSP